MLLIIGGVPDALYREFQQKSVDVFRKNRFVGTPLKSSGRHSYELNISHANDLRNLTIKELENGAITTDGVGVLYFAPHYYHDHFVEDAFFPACLCKRLELPYPVFTTGGKAAAFVRDMVSVLRADVVKFMKSVSAMAAETRTRQNRTPLLLPPVNFSSTILDTNLQDLFAHLPSCPDPHAAIRKACGAVEVAHPFVPKGDRRSARFVNGAKVEFTMPGRDLHARAWKLGAGHQPRCFLNARLRLSGPIADGFHYDCYAPYGRELRGEFSNCHQVVTTYRGNPHLNIAPNDAVR